MASGLKSSFRGLLCWAVVFCAANTFASPARAAFHLWNLNEIYTDSSGTLQFIELSTIFGSQQFVAGQSINVSNLGMTLTNMFTIPSNLPGDSADRRFLIGTAGIQAAGGPAPDYIMPNNFLFAAGGTINFFGANSGPYSALPTDGSLSRTWTGGNFLNSPTNFAGQTGVVTVPEPTTLILAPLAVGSMCWASRRRKARRSLSQP